MTDTAGEVTKNYLATTIALYQNKELGLQLGLLGITFYLDFSKKFIARYQF